MPIIVESRPNNFSSAYTPVEYTFSTTSTGITGTIDSVFTDSSGSFEGLAIFVIDGLTGSAIQVAGGILTISDSTDGIYDGEHVVINAFGDGRVRVESLFLGNSTGDSSYSRLNATLICQLFIDGSFVIEKTRFPDENDLFVFDFQREIQTQLGNDMFPVELGNILPVINGEASGFVHVQYTESFDAIIDGIATPTLLPEVLIDDSVNAITVINSTVPYLEWKLGSIRSQIISIGTDLDEFIVDSVASNRFLTNSPKTIEIGRNDSYQLSAIIDYDPSITTYRRRIAKYTSSGAPDGVTTSNIGVGFDSVWNLTCGTRDTPSITSSTTSYDVSIINHTTGDVLSEVITFNINDKCYGTETRFVWLNSRGGYDAFTFKSPRKLNSSVSKGSFNPSRSYPISIGNREEATTSVIAKDTLTTSTNKVTKEVAEWLQELLESPQVFIELDVANPLHDKRIPVTLINKTRSICNSYDGLFNVSLRYKFAFNKTSLRAY